MWAAVSAAPWARATSVTARTKVVTGSSVRVGVAVAVAVAVVVVVAVVVASSVAIGAGSTTTDSTRAAISISSLSTSDAGSGPWAASQQSEDPIHIAHRSTLGLSWGNSVALGRNADCIARMLERASRKHQKSASISCAGDS